MKRVKYTSIKSVLYDLSEIIPARNWNEVRFLEWATKGAARTEAETTYEMAVAMLPVIEHTASLPSDLVYITQIAYKLDTSTQDIQELQKAMGLEVANWNPAVNHMENPTGLPTAAAEAFAQYIQTS